jgi:hypothetical protein
VPVESGPLLLVRDLLCDVGDGPRVLLSTYSLLSLAGFFLVGSFVGHHYALAEALGGLARFGRRLVRAAAALAALALVLVGLWAAGRLGAPLLSWRPVRAMLYPQYYLTLYPGYLAVTLAVTGLVLQRGTLGPLGRFFETFGKTSLFTYVAQYYVVQTLPWALGLSRSLTLLQTAAWLAASLPLLWAAAQLWNRCVKKA